MTHFNLKAHHAMEKKDPVTTCDIKTESLKHYQHQQQQNAWKQKLSGLLTALGY